MGEHLVFIFVKQILEGLVYLHSQGIIHRDIKGANLLLTKNGVIKLADFGYSILNEKNKANSIVGTACWMAPEVIEQKGNISPKCDIWSLGATIIQLLTTKPPYYEFNALAAMFRIVRDQCPPLPEGISNNLKDFLLRCFEKDPEKRASAKELLNHPWITTPNKKLVKRIIHDNNNNVIPRDVIDEWKNNYKEKLQSIGSKDQSNKETRKSKSKSNSVVETVGGKLVGMTGNDECYDEERFSKKKRIKGYSTPKTNDRNSEYLNINSEEKANSHEDKNSSTGSVIIENEDEIYIDEQMVLTNRSNDSKINKEIEDLFIMINKKSEEFIKSIVKDYKTNFNIFNSLLSLSNGNKNEINLNDIITSLIHILSNLNQNNIDNVLLSDLSLLYKLFISNNNLINDFINDFTVTQFINLICLNCISSDSLLIILHCLNLFLSKNSNLIVDILISQSIFHLSRLIHIFNSTEIKIEIFKLINYCIKDINTIKLFLAANGILLLTTLIDPMIVNPSNSSNVQGDLLVILSLNYIITILDTTQDTLINQTSLLMINNKIYPRLNLLLVLIENDDSIANKDNNINNINKSNYPIILDKILSIVYKLTSNTKHTYTLLNDKIINTLINYSSNLTSEQTEIFLKIFDHIISNTSNLNKLENVGYIETLTKLLNSYSFSDKDENINKLILITMDQIYQIIKMNPAKGELFVMNNGINILCNIVESRKKSDSIYSQNIIEILSEVINSSEFCREKLKESNILSLLGTMLIKYKDSKNILKSKIKMLIQIILVWLREDKTFVEEFLIQKDIFKCFFENLNKCYEGNVNEYLSIINELITSDEIQNKIFIDEDIIITVVDKINKINIQNLKDIHLLNKIMDFYVCLIKNKYNDKEFLNEINFFRNLEMINIIVKEKQLVIIDEKLSNINKYIIK